ncbi:MAG TPA: hypothetical protein VEX70_11080 [Pyrinomonadaceae bacterium]|nr:hypothetical protein [Pyrinomonadaceae bacterium]
MKARTILLALVILCAAGSNDALSQEAVEIEILHCSWTKERIRQRPSMLPFASPDELIRQSQRESQLAAARNSSNKGAAGKIESQITNHEQAMAKASQTDPPGDAYKYVVKLRNNGSKVIKSIDWDYLFLDPDTSAVVSRHQFTSDDTIKPGKSKEISVLYLNPPVKTVSAKMLGKKTRANFKEQVVLMRVQFSDGSVWQHP